MNDKNDNVTQIKTLIIVDLFQAIKNGVHQRSEDLNLHHPHQRTPDVMAGAFSKLEEVKLGCPLPIAVLISIFSGKLLGKSISIGFRCNGREPRHGR